MKGILKMNFPKANCAEGVLMIDGHVVQYDQWAEILVMLNHVATYRLENNFAVIESF